MDMNDLSPARGLPERDELTEAMQQIARAQRGGSYTKMAGSFSQPAGYNYDVNFESARAARPSHGPQVQPVQFGNAGERIGRIVSASEGLAPRKPERQKLDINVRQQDQPQQAPAQLPQHATVPGKQNVKIGQRPANPWGMQPTVSTTPVSGQLGGQFGQPQYRPQFPLPQSPAPFSPAAPAAPVQRPSSVPASDSDERVARAFSPDEVSDLQERYAMAKGTEGPFGAAQQRRVAREAVGRYIEANPPVASDVKGPGMNHPLGMTGRRISAQPAPGTNLGGQFENLGDAEAV